MSFMESSRKPFQIGSSEGNAVNNIRSIRVELEISRDIASRRENDEFNGVHITAYPLSLEDMRELRNQLNERLATLEPLIAAGKLTLQNPGHRHES